MNIKYLKSQFSGFSNNIIVIPIHKDEKIQSEIKELNIISDEFEGIYNKIEVIKAFVEEKIVNVCLIGFGEKEGLDCEKARVLGGNLVKSLKTLISEKNNQTCNVDIINLNIRSEISDALVEGMILGNYYFNKYKTNNNIKEFENINIHSLNEINENESIKLLAQSTIIARDLVNEPSNIMTPKRLSKEVLNLGKEYGFEVDVYDKDKIKELGMDAFLEVAKGSENKPKFIVMRYMGDENSTEILGLVGKGLTYDSGGYSIKPTTSMINMKTDMAGAASVIGAMCAISKDKVKKNVVAVVAACENLISGKAYKPGDIINSMGNKTIEIVNTDAEGRLTLADAVYYIVNNEKATSVVDIATLTGAAVVALGSVASTVVTNNDEFYKELEEAANLSGEKVWKMPVFDEYKKALKGKEADLKNSGGREGGCITAGLFIGEFVGNIPWIHIDIAGTSEINKCQGYKSKGATGEGVRTLYYLAKNKK